MFIVAPPGDQCFFALLVLRYSLAGGHLRATDPFQLSPQHPRRTLATRAAQEEVESTTNVEQ